VLPELIASFGKLGYDVVKWFWQTEGWTVRGGQWLTMRRWLEANPEDELAKMSRELTAEPVRYARTRGNTWAGGVRTDARE
jgi:hypothetical protein